MGTVCIQIRDEVMCMPLVKHLEGALQAGQIPDGMDTTKNVPLPPKFSVVFDSCHMPDQEM